MEDIIKKLKIEIVDLAMSAGEGHIPSAFSILDILWVLYDKVLHYDPKNPKEETRDRFILSKGQAALGLYAVLAEKGFFSKQELSDYCQYQSKFGGHPDRNKVLGVEASTGSLGHGLPMAIGMALALKIKNNPAKVYCLIGDGEANEGSIWEAALLASNHKLDNLCCIVDYNHSTDRALLVGDISDKFRSFGWDVVALDGHNHEQLFKAFKTASNGQPKAVIANTIKGRGVKFMENNPAWHHKAPSREEYAQIMEELTK